MSKDFLVCWTYEEYVPNGTEYEGGEWSGSMVFSTTYGVMRADKGLAIEEIVTVSGFVVPTALPYLYKDEDKTFLAVDRDKVYFACSSDRPDHGISLARLDLSHKTLEIIVPDIMSLIREFIDTNTSSSGSRMELHVQTNNHFFDNEGMKLWVCAGYSGSKDRHYISIDPESLSVSLLFTDSRSEKNYFTEAEFLTANLRDGWYKNGSIGVSTNGVSLIDSDPTTPPIVTATKVHLIGSDESYAITYYGHPETAEVFIYKKPLVGNAADTGLLIGYGDRNEIDRDYPLLIDMDRGEIAYFDRQWEDGQDITYLRIYNFDNERVANAAVDTRNQDGFELPFGVIPYTDGRTDVIFMNGQGVTTITYPDGYVDSFRSPQVWFMDGDKITLSDKHQWAGMYSEDEDGIGYKGTSAIMCLGMISRQQPSNFWTAFKSTQETI